MEALVKANEDAGAPVTLPEILAPAGDRDCFLAALAAGADAIYVGLKHFSARMEAENFGLNMLARLTDLAHERGRRVYVAMNTIIKPGEIGQAYRLTRRLASQVLVDGLIVQDLAMLPIARDADFSGHMAFSTLANVANPVSLGEARAMGADRVIIPRELSIDEIRQMDRACPPGLELECFVHGALCYCVSGRCHWSSYMGGKSGLRGRCVQPCRRLYARLKPGARTGGQGVGKTASPKTLPAARHFSCQDLTLGVIAKTLLSLPNLRAWKIEGRKKGPHYVFHTVTAYRMIRDNPTDAGIRHAAEEILEMALGRPGVKARFLPQRARQPMTAAGQTTTSGLFLGVIRSQADGSPILKPRHALLPDDYLRVGAEDERWHALLPVRRAIPRGGTFSARLPRHKTPPAGTPVFLVDRREPELMRLLQAWNRDLEAIEPKSITAISDKISLPSPTRKISRPNMMVTREISPGGIGHAPQAMGRVTQGVWLSRRSSQISPTLYTKISFWLPPVIWPEQTDMCASLIERLWKGGARHFVCNAPWQMGFFRQLSGAGADIVAGPFCNTANALALAELQRAGFVAAFASPELGGEELLALPSQSPLPLGLILGGCWPVGISRFGLAGINPGELFQSPRGEMFWSRDYGGTIWIYPAWPLDLSTKKVELTNAGYSFFAWLAEKPPQMTPIRQRPGLFNWECGLV